MFDRRSRLLFAVALIGSTVTAVLTSSAVAQAHPVTSGSFEVTLEPGAEPLTYVIGVDASMVADSTDDQNTVSIGVNGFNGDRWSLILGAPFPDPLTVGTYTGATRASFRLPGTPGLDFSGNGVGCSTLTGSFVVNAITFGPNRYVETLDATFEQFCEGAGLPATGHVVIANPPAPPLLDVALTIAGTGTVAADGLVTLHGTVTCSKPTDIELNGSVTQVIRHVAFTGSFFTQFTCTANAPAPWEATSVSDGPFRKGSVDVTARASGWDSFYGTTIADVQAATVRLRRT
jgi:hypothetical protein